MGAGCVRCVMCLVVSAFSHHCMGLLTVICPNTDTFQIGQLPAGDYTFDFTLTSGFGGSGCSPGIIPDGDDQIQFTVSESVGIQEYVDADISLYPNPADDRLFFPRPMQQTYYLADPSGKLILDIPPGTFELDISGLRPGMYLLRSSDRTFKLIKL